MPEILQIIPAVDWAVRFRDPIGSGYLPETHPVVCFALVADDKGRRVVPMVNDWTGINIAADLFADYEMVNYFDLAMRNEPDEDDDAGAEP
jgi:hypothetical protein